MRRSGSEHLRHNPAEAHDPDLVRYLGLYAPRLITPEQRARWLATDGLFLTVVVRTQGTRSDLLREALLCLCGQDSDEFEVVVVLHGGDDQVRRAVAADMRHIQAVLPGRTRMVTVSGGTRVRPVVAGVEAAAGRYVVVLDDDDHVTADWVSTFRRLWLRAPGRVLRVGGGVRETMRLDERPSKVRVAESGVEPIYCEPWSFDRHLRENGTPFHCFAFPVFAVRDLGITLDESLVVVEDWDFLLRVAGALGVSEEIRLTAVYNMGETDSSQNAISESVWRSTEERIRQKHRNAPRPLTQSDHPPERWVGRASFGSGRLGRWGRSFTYVYATEGSRGVTRRIYARATGLTGRDR